ncbi:hypothetical protein M0811_07654 [Anaeramoeba ignava]|uniref:Uncharacterized protein n=1 Tax=Anaeramoeba ignava TaxID=1746090 RepID=A0A9Q0LLY1_ANAIG|nr:hypothetical protein M0811_07654 [Anaeramoeba ignava]
MLIYQIGQIIQMNLFMCILFIWISFTTFSSPHQKEIENFSSSSLAFSTNNFFINDALISSQPIIFLRFLRSSKHLTFLGMNEKFITLDRQGNLAFHSLYTIREKIVNLISHFQKDIFKKGYFLTNRIVVSDNQKWVICCGYSDNTFKIFDIENLMFL